MKTQKNLKGFTLIELAIAIVVIAILISIAYPMYKNQIRKARRSAALSTLMSMQSAEESYRYSNTQYGSLAQVWNGVTQTDDNYYTLAISNTSATSYTLTATPTGDQANDSQSGTACTPLSIAVANGTATKTPANCW